MNYFLQYQVGGKETNLLVDPSHIRDAHVGETVMMETFAPETFKHKTFARIQHIKIEKGKRTYELTFDYVKSIREV